MVATGLVSVDGVFEPPEERVFSYSNDEMNEANAAGATASDGLRTGAKYARGHLKGE